MDAQFAFFSDVSKKLFDGIQRVNELNVQVAQTVMDETINNSQQLVQADSAHEYLAVAVGQIQPTPEKLRAYQQQLNNIVAGVQVELSKTAENHVPDTVRTAAAFAEDVVRRGDEEAEKASQIQKDAFQRQSKSFDAMRDTQASNGNGNGRQYSQQPTAKPSPVKNA
jgi:phasin family protein